MSYHALYRKYRPQTFEEVVGQTHVVRTLQNALKNNQIAHAYLFCGPRGTGKTSIAKLFARALNCTSEQKPCLTCENCKSALNNSFMDIIEMDAASNNSVENVRELVGNISYPPIKGKYKVYIIDEVHMMSKAAFNALLKTIEEPPEHVIFIFATTEPDKVIDTILSRCQRYDFKSVSEPDIQNRLIQVCQSEHINADTDALALIASLANGGMRDALSILDQCYAYSPDHISRTTIQNVYGLITEQDIGRLFSQLNTTSAAQAAEQFHAFYQRGMDLKRFMNDLIALIKDSMILDLNPQSPMISASRALILQQYFCPFSRNKRSALSAELLQILQHISNSTNIQDHIEIALLNNCCDYDEHPALSAAETQPVQPASQTAAPVQNVPQPASQPAAPAQSIPQPVQTASQPVSQPAQAVSSPTPDSSAPAENQPVQPPVSTHDNERMELYLSMLACATKREKLQAIFQLQQILPYASHGDPTVAQLSASLFNTEVYVAGTDFILLQTSTAAHAQQINDNQKRISYTPLWEWITQTSKTVFAVSQEEVQQLTQEYMIRRQNNTLPEPFNSPKK